MADLYILIFGLSVDYSAIGIGSTSSVQLVGNLKERFLFLRERTSKKERKKERQKEGQKEGQEKRRKKAKASRQTDQQVTKDKEIAKEDRSKESRP